MESRLVRDVRLLKIYAVLLTLFCALVLLTAFQNGSKTRFAEIDAERVNIVEPNGKIDLAISNAARFPPPVMNGIVMKRSGEVGKGTPGMIFFNGKGEEQGGMAWNSRTEDGKFSAEAALMFDQYNQDQTIGITYDDNNGLRSAGLHVWDHPNSSTTELWKKSQEVEKMPEGEAKQAARKRLHEEWGSQRVFIGKQPDRSAVLLLADTQGRPRIRLAVDAAGNPRIELLDANGKTISSLTPQQDSAKK